TNVYRFDNSDGVNEYVPVLFSSLPSGAKNGTLIYCSDCMVASPCTGNGTGAFAKRINGAWRCN
ncbi:MAG TPA: hypothetical protein VHG30_11115, partial [Microvirga sp.]|nr:hypothetical protein [Microvirga sp.]